MTNEIKEIYLSNLEWTKTHDNMGGVIGNVIFKDNMSYETYQKLLKSSYFALCDKDYITNLQKENERVSNLYKTYEEANDLWIERNENLHERIDKAVEYIKWNLDKNEELIEYFNYDANFNELLNILRGDE